MLMEQRRAKEWFRVDRVLRTDHTFGSEIGICLVTSGWSVSGWLWLWWGDPDLPKCGTPYRMTTPGLTLDPRTAMAYRRRAIRINFREIPAHTTAHRTVELLI